jgi:ubiquinone biosynthesis monooxygenase Coq7
MLNIDRLIGEFDKGLRALFVHERPQRPMPGEGLNDASLSKADQERSCRLMRINHCGEVSAQALYQGQALTARNPDLQRTLSQAAQEEGDHLAWCRTRIQELGGRQSLLNPIWYTGSLVLGALAGATGDRWNLAFLAETEHQVVEHLERHLKELPAGDHKSCELIRQMQLDEAKHATTALEHGAIALPLPVKSAMRFAAQVMIRISYWV